MEISEKNICVRGIWDSTIPGIKFNDNGESNYSMLMDKLIQAYPRGEKGKEEWNSIVKRIKESGRRGKYDCIIGVSGGTDSSYLLYLARQENLRPLPVHLDNGWNSEVAVRNIQKLTVSLGLDLETYVINYEEIKELFRAYMKAGLPWIDMPSDLAIKAVLYKIAAKENIKFILRGNDFRSEGTQPREWTYGDGKQLEYIYKNFGSSLKLKTFPNYNLNDLLYYSLIKGIKSVYPFYYIDYKKKEAQRFLAEKFGWEYYGGHHYENTFTRFAISFWLYEKFGIDKRRITLSAQVLSGELSRDEALKAISEKPYNEDDKQFMLEFVLKKLDFTPGEFEECMKAPNHSFYDYPSSYKLIDRMNYFSKFIIRRVFIHKPQSLFQAEMRKERPLTQ